MLGVHHALAGAHEVGAGLSPFTHDSRALAEAYDRVSDLQFESGRRLVERTYTWDALAPALLDVVERVAARTRS